MRAVCPLLGRDSCCCIASKCGGTAVSRNELDRAAVVKDYEVVRTLETERAIIEIEEWGKITMEFGETGSEY
jgi:hypothetical protein